VGSSQPASCCNLTKDIAFSSGSMKSLWQEARSALVGIVAKSILYDKDGIDIFFLNSERTLEGCTSTQAVERLFGDVRPRGSTPTAVRLDEILRPYVGKVEDAKSARSTLPKPLVSIDFVLHSVSRDLSKFLRR
jgi:hypothetical protein